MQPPPVEMILPESFPSSRRAAVSSIRKLSSPSCTRMSRTRLPVLSSTRLSESRKGLPVITLSLDARVLFPQPGMPMRMMFRISFSRERRIGSRTASGMARPVKSSLERLAWATSIRRPPKQGMPSSSARSIRAVRAGL